MLRSKHPSDSAFEAWVDDADGGAIDILRTHVVQAGFRAGWIAATNTQEEDVARLQMVRDDLERKYARLQEAARSILWMARAYAEGGGRGGPEMRDYEAAAEVLGED